ncbi:hypothetical protein H0H81_001897 [Sphagnurus paluster]|uniref:G domain-containing protein n=1 Tax=Sphagnurus paluster TaxID=117069 RepID=A0A9P7GPQ7_9AGAR|nr:hypothetical protein H0H81_001897 [Sphagnurus paluster]
MGRKSKTLEKESKDEDKFMTDPRKTDIFINTLMGKEVTLVGHNLKSQTVNIQHFVITHPDPKFKDRRVIVLDTPGFDDTFVDDREILRRIAVWLGRSYEEEMKLGGLIYLHEITQPRMLGSARKNLDMFNKLCGPSAAKNVYLVTNKWGDVPTEVGQNREKQLQSQHWREMLDNGAKILRFDLNQESAVDIIGQILRNGNNAVAQIQSEIIDEKSILAETGAGRTLHYTLEEHLKMQKQLAAQLRKEEHSPQLQKQIEENQKNIDIIVAQMKELKIPFSRKLMRLLGLV